MCLLLLLWDFFKKTKKKPLKKILINYIKMDILKYSMREQNKMTYSLGIQTHAAK